jgi:hypothetical protein
MLQIQTYNYAVDIHHFPRHQHILKSTNSAWKRYPLNSPCDFCENTSLYISPKYGFADIIPQRIHRELGFDSSALNEAKVNYASCNTKAP